MGKPEGKKPFGRPRRRWKDNIEMHLQEVGLEHGLLGQVAGPCECDKGPLGSIKHGEFLDCLRIFQLRKKDTVALN